MTNAVFPPYPIFSDRNGSQLDGGYLYIGELNQNPETNPVEVFWDYSRTIPALQPIRTVNGWPSRDGSPAIIYTESDYSITVRDSRQALVIYYPASLANGTNVALQLSAVEFQYTATAGQTVFSGVDQFGNVMNLPGVVFATVAGSALSIDEIAVAEDGRSVTLVLPDPILEGDAVVFRGNLFLPSMDSYQYPELASESTERTLRHRYDLLDFEGAKAELAKPEAEQDWIGVLNEALQSGRKIHVGSGRYPIRSKLNASTGLSVVDKVVDVECASDAVFVLTDIDFTGGLFDVRATDYASATNRLRFRWVGGSFDCTALNPTLPFGISIFDLFNLTKPEIDSVDFYAYDEAGAARKIDTAITLHRCPGFSVTNIYTSGMQDSGVYMSGDNTSGSFNVWADGGKIDGLTAYQCNNGVTLKRWHRGAEICNFVMADCDNGILSSPTDGSTTNHGHSAYIHDGTMRRMAGRPILITGGKDAKIRNVVIEDYGCTLADPTIPTIVSSDNHIAGIDLRAVSGGLVDGCTIRQDAWAGATQADSAKYILGIRLGRYSTTGTVYSSDCVIRGNNIIGAMRGILEDAGCENNEVTDNRVTPPASGTMAKSAVLGAGTVYKPADKFYTLTNDPTSIAAGGELVITITAAEVNKGDIVFAWMGNRSAGDTGVNALDMKALCADGQIDIVLTNNAASSADLGNTVFNALARPTI